MSAFLFSPWLAVFAPVALFFAWNQAMFRGEAKIPRRSWVLLVVATALTVIWFVGGWRYGLEYQGLRHTRFVCAVNVIWLALLWTLFLATRKGPASFKLNLLLHWILFAWLAWYAFPWLGELP
jgi:hypothetical protein